MAEGRRPAPLTKNQRVRLIGEQLTTLGSCIAHYQGMAVFVTGLLPGEEAEVQILLVKKQYAFGRIETLISESPERVKPSCPYFPRCGGCSLQHASYGEQLRYKRCQLYDAFLRLAGVDLVELPQVIGMKPEELRFYRNKAQFPVRMVDGVMRAGFFAPRSHRLIPIDLCEVQSQASNRLMPLILSFCNEHGITAYDEETHQGQVRHILIRDGRKTGQVMVCLVMNVERLPYEKELAQMLLDQGVHSVSVNINKGRTNVILGSQTRTIGGADRIQDQIGSLEFSISPQSFFQVNPLQTQHLYELALDMSGLTGKEIVWDAYCGTGTISLFLAQRAAHVYGVEIVETAVEDARENARHNRVENVTFFTGKAEEVIPAHYERTGIRPDVMVVDPPRSGCDEALLDTILHMQPERLVYVSCDPGTLCRDVKILLEGGMKLKQVKGVDMFPGTVHVETVCLMSRVKE